MLIVLISWLSTTLSAFGQYVINGIDAVCPGVLESYTVNGNLPFSSVVWQVTPNTGSIVNLAVSGCDILWGPAGSAVVSATLYDAANQVLGTASLNVTVNPAPSPSLTTSFKSDCIIIRENQPQIEPNECWNVCRYSYVDYFVNPYHPSSQFIWSVSGEQFSTPNNNTLNVNWGPAGNGLISVTETNQFGCSTTETQCININESPQAIIQVDELNADCRNNSIITVCHNQLINFQGDAILGNTNSPIIAWSWDFGDNTYSSLQNPAHSFTGGQSYVVTLTVTNACNCTASCTLLVNVEPIRAVNIECAAPVCANSLATYYTDAVNCNPYQWQVTGGTIQSTTPYTNQITVLWGDGSSGPGLLCLNNDNGTNCPGYCPSTTCIEIPIIATSSTIAGASIACINEQYAYSVPEMIGSIYTWTVTGGTINSGQNTNEIFVTWTDPGTGSVTVTYMNEFLDCGGNGSLTVEVSSPFSISGPEKGCPGEQLTFTADNPAGIMMDWTATESGSQSYYLGSDPNSISVNWTFGAGSYVIMATPAVTSGYCNPSATITLVIHEPPPVPLPFAGERYVCQMSSHVYSHVPDAAMVYNWTVSGGTPANATGNQISVMWGMNPPYQIQLTQTDLITGCTSDIYTENITFKSYSDPTFASAGNVCINQVESYSINNAYNGNPAGNYFYDDITWMISPATAGTVISGNGTTIAQIQWNNNPGNVSIYVTTRLCGTDYVSYNNASINISLVGQSVVEITPPGLYPPLELCEGVEQTFTIPGTWSSIVWDYGDGSGDIDNIHHWSVSGLGAGPFTFPVTVIAEDADGCIATGSTTVNITPSPLIGIQNTPNCLDGITDVTLTALTPMVGTYTYQWSNSSPAQSIQISTSGTYTVTVTDQSSGCQSEMDQTIGNCPPIVNACIPDSQIGADFNFTPNTPDCGNFSFNGFFNGTPNGNITAYEWNFGDGSGGSGAVTTHTFAVAAVYQVTLTIYSTDGTTDFCNSYTRDVDVPAVLDFSSELICPVAPSNQYQVQFHDLSTYHPNSPPLNHTWSWSFGSGLQEPLITMPHGIQTVTMLLFDPFSSLVCEIQKPVTIPEPPVASFDITPAMPGPYCAGQTVLELTASNTNVHHALWNFGDGSSYVPIEPGISIDVQKVFDGSELNPVIELTVYDSYGCSYSDDEGVVINLNNLGGFINPFQPVTFCPGGTGQFTLDYSGYSQPSIYMWSNGISTIIPSITVYTTGTYSVTVSSSSTGCSQPIPGFGVALAHNMPSPVIVGDFSICEGEDIVLDGQSGITTSGYIFEWTGSDPGGNPIAQTGPQFSLTSAIVGNYQLTLTITSPSPACQMSVNTAVSVHPAPATPVITITPIPPCEDQAVLLTVDPMGNHVNWSTGSSNASIQAVASGIYEVTLTNEAGCTSTASEFIRDNPYLGWFTYGCFEFCDNVDIVVPGSNPISYHQWAWLVNGVLHSGRTGDVHDLTFPANSLAPGIYIIQLELEVLYPGNPDVTCTIISESLEITVRTCPCNLEPKIEIWCVTPQINDGAGPHTYHFEITTGLLPPCTNDATVVVSSPNGGVNLLAGTSQPGFLEGMILTGLNHPSAVCFDLSITDQAEPSCNCLYRLCRRLPDCPGIMDCEDEVQIQNVQCIGYSNGFPVYSFDLVVSSAGGSYPDFLTFSATSQGVLSGFQSVFINSSGSYTYSGTFTDYDPSDGFCVEVSFYDMNNHTICVKKACEYNPPVDCRLGEFKTVFQTETHINLKPELTLTPNPTTGEAIIHFRNIQSAGVIQIVTADGRLITEWNISEQEGNRSLTSGKLKPGIYSCMLRLSDGTLLVKRLVVL